MVCPHTIIAGCNGSKAAASNEAQILACHSQALLLYRGGHAYLNLEVLLSNITESQSWEYTEASQEPSHSMARHAHVSDVSTSTDNPPGSCVVGHNAQ